MSCTEFIMRPAFVIALSMLLAPIAGAQEVADVLLTGGKILTVDADFSTAQAIALKGERILAVGSNADLAKLKGPDTEVMDLKGATVLPGLIDSHVHATSAAMHEFEHTYPEFETIQDVLDYIGARAEEADDGEWITLSQVFITRLRERRYPTRAEMDEVAPNNPVKFATGPDASVNSMALELSGIDEDFVLPEGSKSRLERDPKTGKLTGIIRSPGSLIKASRSNRVAPTMDDRANRLAELFADYNKVGITSVSDRNASESGIRVYQQLLEEDRLNCRVYLYRGIGGGGSGDELAKKLDQIVEHPLHEYSNRLWLNGVKLFLDGGMLTGSAYMLEPWGVSESYGIVDPAYRGTIRTEPDQLYEMVRAAMERDLQFTAHAVGDGAVERLVDAYSQVAEKDFPVRDKRPCVTHCNFMSPRAIAKMAKHGIVADLQPAWLYLDGSTLTQHFGNKRLRWFQPYHTLFEKGVVVGGGSDHMQKIGSLRAVNPYNPFLGMWITLTRQPRWMDGALHPVQRISRPEAIRLYTINNAYLTFEEKEKGSLEAGKLADFVLLDRDILTCPLEQVREIQVQQTWLGGERVYEAGASE